MPSSVWRSIRTSRQRSNRPTLETTGRFGGKTHGARGYGGSGGNCDGNRLTWRRPNGPGLRRDFDVEGLGPAEGAVHSTLLPAVNVRSDEGDRRRSLVFNPMLSWAKFCKYLTGRKSSVVPSSWWLVRTPSRT